LLDGAVLQDKLHAASLLSSSSFNLEHGHVVTTKPADSADCELAAHDRVYRNALIITVVVVVITAAQSAASHHEGPRHASLSTHACRLPPLDKRRASQ
jgi:hypothetical protein